MNRKLLFPLFALLLAFSLPSNAQLPSVTIKTMDGKTVNVDTLSNGGKPFIIDFFATWCKPCNRELDAVSEVYEDWQQETGVKLLDPNGDLKRALGIQMIPYVLIVDGQGNIVYRHAGYTDGEETELIEKVKELIN